MSFKHTVTTIEGRPGQSVTFKFEYQGIGRIDALTKTCGCVNVGSTRNLFTKGWTVKGGINISPRSTKGTKQSQGVTVAMTEDGIKKSYHLSININII